MKNISDKIVYLVGILFTIGSLIVLKSRYQSGRLSETLQEPESYIGFGFGIMAICYYLLKRKNTKNSNEPIINKQNIIAIIIISIMFVGFGFFLLNTDISYNSRISNLYVKYIIGWLSIIFFGLIMILSLRTLWIISFKKLSFYYFDKDYFCFYNQLTARYIKIPIDKIEQFETINYLNNKFVLVIVDDEGNHLNKVEKFLSKWNKNNFGTYYCFNLNGTSLDESNASRELNKELKNKKIEHNKYIKIP